MTTVRVQDPMVLLEMLLRFGRSPDGAVESDLRRAINSAQQARLNAEDALTTIAEQDPIELVLDPEWPQRIARQCLASPNPAASTPRET